MHLKLLKCSFDINVGFLEMRSCYDQMSSHNFAMSRTQPLSQSLSHGYGSKQRRECRTADTLSTELSQHLQFLQWFIKQQGCGFVSEAKARIGGRVSADRGQARSGAGRMLAAQCGHRHRSQNSKT